MKVTCANCSTVHEIEPPPWVVAAGKPFPMVCSNCKHSQPVFPTGLQVLDEEHVIESVSAGGKPVDPPEDDADDGLPAFDMPMSSYGDPGSAYDAVHDDDAPIEPAPSRSGGGVTLVVDDAPQGPVDSEPPGFVLRSDGDLFHVPDMATLQRWIMEQRVLPADELRLEDGSWVGLATRDDLRLFFDAAARLAGASPADAVDEAHDTAPTTAVDAPTRPSPTLVAEIPPDLPPDDDTTEESVAVPGGIDLAGPPTQPDPGTDAGTDAAPTVSDEDDRPSLPGFVAVSEDATLPHAVRSVDPTLGAPSRGHTDDAWEAPWIAQRRADRRRAAVAAILVAVTVGAWALLLPDVRATVRELPAVRPATAAVVGTDAAEAPPVAPEVDDLEAEDVEDVDAAGTPEAPAAEAPPEPEPEPEPVAKPTPPAPKPKATTPKAPTTSRSTSTSSRSGSASAPSTSTAGSTATTSSPSRVTPSPAVTPEPTSSSYITLVEQGWGALERNDLQAAFAAFERAVKVAPLGVDANYGLGYTLLQRGRTTEATRYLCRAGERAVGNDKREIEGVLRHRGLTCEGTP